ncbi:MAG: efflux RND transporter periplasmic adaptor subunit [Bacteroidota bacterium]|nr:efflux RND transporter periplasmic adaptor subunit [Bacteroidota bacterium]
MDKSSDLSTPFTATNDLSGNGATKNSEAPSAKKPIVIKKRKKKTKNIIIAISALAIVGLGAWYFFFRGEAAQIPFIRFAVVDKGDIVKSVTATGTLQATTTVQVGSQVSGTIKALHADFNTRVTKGQLVAELDPTFYEASVKAAQANFERAKADMEIAKRNADRSKELLSKDLISKAEDDVAATTYETAQSTVKQMKAALDQAQVNLSYTRIHAPISGVVTQRSVDVGQTVAASLNAPVLFIIAEDLQEMEVQANVDEADIGQVKQGEDVSFTVDAFPGEKFHGNVKMVRLNPIIQQNVVTYTVVISAQNKEEKLFPGMTATVTIVNSAVQDVIRVPVAATRFTPPNLEASAEPAQGPRSGKRDSTRAKGDSTSRGGRQRSNTATIYRRSNKPVQPGEVPVMEPVKIKMGISDGMLTEVLSSDPQLNLGDSIAVGSVLPAKTGATSAPGTNPFGTPARPGGGAARGR